jgi:hypothetical protein
MDSPIALQSPALAVTGDGKLVVGYTLLVGQGFGIVDREGDPGSPGRPPPRPLRQRLFACHLNIRAANLASCSSSTHLRLDPWPFPALASIALRCDAGQSLRLN